MSRVSLSEWSGFLDSLPEAHILQTGEWGQLKSAFGWDVVRLRVGSIGTQILFRQLPLGLSFAYVAKGPTGRGNEAEAQALWDEVETECHRRHAIFLTMEPDAWDGGSESEAARMLSVAAGARLNTAGRSIQPRRTIIVDLQGSEDSILSRLKPKCRYNIGLARRKGIEVRPWGDVAAFHAMMVHTGKRDGFGVHSAQYLTRAYDLFRKQGQAEVFAAVHDGKPLAGLMVFRRGRRAWYFYGASSDEKRELMPNYLLQWEAMRWAKQTGAEEYDLWGVPDQDEAALEAGFEHRHDGLWGVYRFKRGFGGQVRRAAQAQDRVYQPILYALYRNMIAGRSSA